MKFEFHPVLFAMAIWDVWNLNTSKEVLHPHSNTSQERGKEVSVMMVVMQAKVALHFRAERDNTEPFTQEGHAVEESLHKGHTARLCRPCRPVTQRLPVCI